MVRILFYKNGCPHCRNYYGIVEKINAALPPHKRIKKVEVHSFDSMKDIYYKELKKGVPYLVIDGFAIRGSTTRNFVEGFLRGYLKNDFIV